MLYIPSSAMLADTLSEQFPGDTNIHTHPSVIFHENFEDGWKQWDYPRGDTRHLKIKDNQKQAHSGNAYLKSITRLDDLEKLEHISAAARHTLEHAVDEVYWRMYVQLKGLSPKPHHWIKLAATDGEFDIRGKANRKPDGDDAFWLTLDINHLNQPYYYIYWHNMRSGRCNDGSTQQGCAGDQGTTYYYGNRFSGTGNSALKQDKWQCIEIHARANTPGKMNGELSLYIDGIEQIKYQQGSPEGTWLRSTFHPDGCDFKACTEAEAFEGFDFRKHNKVLFRQIFLDAYNQLDTFSYRLSKMKSRGESPSSIQKILYDDLVVATERIGCMSHDDKRNINPVKNAGMPRAKQTAPP